MTCAQGLLRLLWGGGHEVGVLRDWTWGASFRFYILVSGNIQFGSKVKIQNEFREGAI